MPRLLTVQSSEPALSRQLLHRRLADGQLWEPVPLVVVTLRNWAAVEVAGLLLDLRVGDPILDVRVAVEVGKRQSLLAG